MSKFSLGEIDYAIKHAVEQFGKKWNINLSNDVEGKALYFHTQINLNDVEPDGVGFIDPISKAIYERFYKETEFISGTMKSRDKTESDLQKEIDALEKKLEKFENFVQVQKEMRGL